MPHVFGPSVTAFYKVSQKVSDVIRGGAENAGVENAGADCRGGKCRSGKYRSDKVWKAIRRRDENSASMPAFVGESKFRIIICLHFLYIYSI